LLLQIAFTPINEFSRSALCPLPTKPPPKKNQQPKQMQWGEAAAHAVEAAILSLGLAALYLPPPSSASTSAAAVSAAVISRALVTCYFADLLLALAPDLLRYLLTAALAARRWLFAGRGGGASGTGANSGGNGSGAGGRRAVANARW
jgi:uncharacterized membrane protein YgcG